MKCMGPKIQKKKKSYGLDHQIFLGKEIIKWSIKKGNII